MTSVELYLLGRKLMKIGEAGLPGRAAGGLAPSVRMVLMDVGENPGTSIGDIVARTGFPQSHVSASVARLRELGALETEVDAHDGRRTLVRLAPGMRERARRAARHAAAPVDDALAAALRTGSTDDLDAVKGALDTLATRLLSGFHQQVTAEAVATATSGS